MLLTKLNDDHIKDSTNWSAVSVNPTGYYYVGLNNGGTHLYNNQTQKFTNSTNGDHVQSIISVTYNHLENIFNPSIDVTAKIRTTGFVYENFLYHGSTPKFVMRVVPNYGVLKIYKYILASNVIQPEYQEVKMYQTLEEVNQNTQLPIRVSGTRNYNILPISIGGSMSEDISVEIEMQNEGKILDFYAIPNNVGLKGN